MIAFAPNTLCVCVCGEKRDKAASARELEEFSCLVYGSFVCGAYVVCVWRIARALFARLMDGSPNCVAPEVSNSQMQETNTTKNSSKKANK